MYCVFLTPLLLNLSVEFWYCSRLRMRVIGRLDRVMCPKDVDRLAISVDPDLIWAYTVWPDLSVQKPGVITVF